MTENPVLYTICAYVHISKFAIDTAFLDIFEIPLIGCPAVLTIFSSTVGKLVEKVEN